MSFEISVAFSHVGQSPICLVEKGFSWLSLSSGACSFFPYVLATMGKIGFVSALFAIPAFFLGFFLSVFDGNGDSADIADFFNSFRDTSNRYFPGGFSLCSKR